MMNEDHEEDVEVKEVEYAAPRTTRWLIIGGVVVGVAVVAITGFVIARKLFANPYGQYLSQLGLTPGVEPGQAARRNLNDRIIKYAIQDYGTYGNSTCVNCLRYGKWGGGSGSSPQYNPEYQFWWDMYTGLPGRYQSQGEKIRSKFGCNPYLKYSEDSYTKTGGVFTPDPDGSGMDWGLGMNREEFEQYGNVDCMGQLMQAADEFKNRCVVCQNTTFR
jgi:hypothetical protein